MVYVNRNAALRQRKEYLHRQHLKVTQANIQIRKQKLKQRLENNEKIQPAEQRHAEKNIKSMEFDDAGGEMAGRMGRDHGGAPGCDLDDEYRRCGVEDPRLVITTSHEPSSRLQIFAKEMKLILPNSERINRGNYDLHSLVDSAKAHGFTDLLLLSGKCSNMIISHLPHGPTAYFTVSNLKLRHDATELAKMPEVFPHTVFHNLETALGQRVRTILRGLFPVPKLESRRQVAFVNDADHIHFFNTFANKGEKGVVTHLTELGPRFTLKCYKIIRGTLDQVKAADVEYELRAYTRTAHKALRLSKKRAFEEEDEDNRPSKQKDDIVT